MISGVGMQRFGSSMIAKWQVVDVINLMMGLWQWIGNHVQSFAKPVGSSACVHPKSLGKASVAVPGSLEMEWKSTLPAGMEPNQPYLARRGRPEGSTRLLACSIASLNGGRTARNAALAA